MKNECSNSGCLVFFVIVVIIAIFFTVSYGFSLGGGGIAILSPRTTVDVSGDNNNVIAITGDDNIASVQPAQPKVRDDWGNVFGFLATTVGALIIVFFLAFGGSREGDW